MASIARHHAEWLSLIEVSGPFLSMPVLLDVFPQGLDEVDHEQVSLLRQAYDEWEANQNGARPDPAIHTAWVQWVLEHLLGLRSSRLSSALLTGQALPPNLRASFPEHGEMLQPGYALVNPPEVTEAGQPRLLVQVYPPGQDLDAPVSGSHWKAPPSFRMMELLHATGVRLGLVTNGERWMLVDAPRGETTGFASWYAGMWLEEPLTLRAFCSLLDAHRFFGVESQTTLEELLTKSASSQEEVTNQLGDQVRRAVEMLIQTIDRIDKDRGWTLLVGVSEQALYDAALTVMMRLVFLFCAEERELLPHDNAIYANSYAVSPLRATLREAADQLGEEVLERRRDAWSRLLATFRAVYGGVEYADMRLRAYGGRLFDPDRYPFLEGRQPGTSWRDMLASPLPIDNRTVLHLLEALQMLQVKVPGGGPAEARRLSFRALDIEQIGHVYEGLLDHTAKRAPTPVLGLEGNRDAVSEVMLDELEQRRARGEDAVLDFLKEHTGRSANALKNRLAAGVNADDLPRLLAACDNDDALYHRVLPFAGLLRLDTFDRPVVITAGSIYVTTGADRRTTGTHYTPKSLTEPMVQYTLEPLAYIGPAEGRDKDDWQLRPARALLGLKICDMAMGSGAFLVQTARYLSERLMEAWELAEAQHRSHGVTTPQITPDGALSTGDPTETLIPPEPKERQALALRLICDHCLYGVDKNPMAVEMAKLSLWLVTLDKNRPFTFLDHALRGGDSLLGVFDISQLRMWTLESGNHKDGARPISWLTIPVGRVLAQAEQLRRQIAATPVAQVADIAAKEKLLAQAQQATDILRLGGDLLVAAALAAPRERERLRNDWLHRYSILADAIYTSTAERFMQSAREGIDSHIVALRAEAQEYLGSHHPFHWPFEFPEVFGPEVYDPAQPDGRLDPATLAEWNPLGPGFSAIVGNPPFMGGWKIGRTLEDAYRQYLVTHVALGRGGTADLCAYFFLRAGQLVREDSVIGLLATNTIAQTDTRETGLDQLVTGDFTIIRGISSLNWPGKASLNVALVWLRRGNWGGTFVLDSTVVPGITSALTIPLDITVTPKRLIFNANQSFLGSNVLGIGFVLEPEEAAHLIAKDARNRSVLFPYLGGEDIASRPDQSPSRTIINFFDWSLDEAKLYPDCLAILQDRVKPERQKRKEDGSFALRKPLPERWWQYADKRPTLYSTIAAMKRVLVTVIHAKYHAIASVPCGCVISHGVVVFALEQLKYLALLQSVVHELWAQSLGSSLETRFRYTPSDCFETFPFPDDISNLEDIGERYYTHRQGIMLARQEGLTKTYNRFHNPKESTYEIDELRALHVELDQAVAAAYGWDDLDLGHGFHETKQGLRYTISEAARREVLGRLLQLNHERHAAEVSAGLVDEKGRPLTNGKNGKKATPPPTTRAGTQTNGIAEGQMEYKTLLFEDE